MSINIPKNFSDILNGDPNVQANVAHLCSNAAGLFTLNPDFFPDYTFHGIDHINEVLDHADYLIPEKTRNILTPQDIAFLVSAIAIHDLGMFLAEDGVRRLITGDLRKRRLEGFEDDPWEKAWENYTDRVKRYTQEKMLHLFGGNITVDPDCVKKQPIDSENDRRVIGEFLRQEHPRLAHEIAVNFFPGDKASDIFKNTSFDETDRDMIGLLARSHGMAIRDTEDYCEGNYEEGSKPCNIPIFYLMAVLRIADLLDAGSHRAPNIRQDVKKIRIPISVEEWTWNQRITPKKCKWDIQKGKRHIFAEPTTSIEYVQLDHWLSRLQAELDLSWSVLSEKYPTEDYRLSIHRVTSNIRETSVRKKMNENFLTKEAKVTANPEIVKLLMEPLYGDDPSYGVRELLQNAVDACIERERKEGGSYKGQVTIRVDEKYFTIEDNGIGMDENVLLNYYFSAGSSYRDSDEWKREFTENGESQIARSGRFGVGFLASFLLGDEITVHTQHMADKKGYAFSFDQDSRPLNIQREERPERTGTTITIRLKEGVYEKLSSSAPKPRNLYSFPDDEFEDDEEHLYHPEVRWTDWYSYETPVVEYHLDGKRLRSKNRLFPRTMTERQDWFSLPSDDFHSYYWRPATMGSSGFFCNGIRIQKWPLHRLDDYGLDVAFPTVLLTDRNGRLKVNLARSRVEAIPHHQKMIEQVFRYQIARLLMTSWDTTEKCAHNMQRSSINDTRFLFSSRGFSLLNLSLQRAMGNADFFELFYNGEDPCAALKAVAAVAPDGIAFSISPQTNSRIHFRSWSTPSSFLENHLYSVAGVTYHMHLYHDTFYVHESLLPSLSERALTQINHPLGITANHIYQSNPKANAFPFDPERFDFQSFPIIIRNGLHYHDTPRSIDTFHRILCQVLECSPNDFWIPFDMEERKKKFPKAFQELKPYLDHIEKFGLSPDFKELDKSDEEDADEKHSDADIFPVTDFDWDKLDWDEFEEDEAESD